MMNFNFDKVLGLLINKSVKRSGENVRVLKKIFYLHFTSYTIYFIDRSLNPSLKRRYEKSSEKKHYFLILVYLIFGEF